MCLLGVCGLSTNAQIEFPAGSFFSLCTNGRLIHKQCDVLRLSFGTGISVLVGNKKSHGSSNSHD